MENSSPQLPKQDTPPVNQEITTSVSQQPQPEARKADNRLLKVLIITIAVFLVVSFFGSWAYYRAWKHQRGSVTSISADRGTHTYRNKEYEFEFKYPGDFYVETTMTKISDFPEAPELGLSLSAVLDEQDTISRSDIDDDCSIIDVPIPQGIKSYCKIKQFGQVKGKLEKYYVGENPSFGIKFVFYKNEARISLSIIRAPLELHSLDSKDSNMRVAKFNEYFDSIIARDSSNPNLAYDLAYYDKFEKILSTLKFIEEDKITEGAQKEEIPEEVIVAEGPINLTENKILFTEKGNIFMMDEFGKITQILKRTGKYPGHAKEQLQIIDDKHLGYYRCDVKTGDFNCGGYRINIASEQPEKLMRAGERVSIRAFDFYSKDIFAYAANFWEEEPQNSYGRIYLYKEGKENVIKEIDFVDYLGDKYTIEAGMTELIFSPDGTKILLGIARIGGYTESIGIFDLYSKELVKIENARGPDWIDKKTIIFGRDRDGYRDLCSFDISSKKEKCYGIDKRAQNPKVLGGSQKVVYWVDEKNIGSIWILDLKSGESEKLLDNAFRPLWISQEKLLVAKNPEEEDLPLYRHFNAAPLSIFNIYTREAFDIEEIDRGWHCFTTSQSKKGYDYYLK